MLFKTFSAAAFGIDAYLVEVEVDIGPGFQGCFSVVGLPDIAVKESRERIKSAVRNCGFDFPFTQIVTVNLAPADIRTERSAFDLPMALGILGCQGTFSAKFSIRMFFWASCLSTEVSVLSAAHFRRRWQRASGESRMLWYRKPMRARQPWWKG
jgi:hypothetical protein